MTDLHDEFASWLASGARDEVPRDVAIHASGCRECLVHAAAFDDLLEIDTDEAPEPPLRAGAIPRSPAVPVRVARAAVGVMAVMLVGAGVIAAGSLFGLSPTDQAGSHVDPTPAEGILAGEGEPSASEGASPTVAASLSPTPSASATPSQREPTPAPRGATPHVSPQPPISTAPATAAPAPSASAMPTETQTATASPAPTATATADPTATPMPTPAPTQPTPTPIESAPTEPAGDEGASRSDPLGGVAALLS